MNKQIRMSLNNEAETIIDVIILRRLSNDKVLVFGQGEIQDRISIAVQNVPPFGICHEIECMEISSFYEEYLDPIGEDRDPTDDINLEQS
jgi:hypothetical protein